jgi:hypothetical protein
MIVTAFLIIIFAYVVHKREIRLNTENSELQEALIPNKELKKVHGDLFQNGSFNNLIQEIEMAKIHCQRIEQKSIATILMYQEKMIS